jgi:Fic family protein
MHSVRGVDKQPGKFRTTQNWIGKPGTPIEQAIFIPPEPCILRDHLDLYEKYIQMDDSDVLVQSAIVHAQFELLHPFLDGNGRIGRLLIPLFLYFKKRLSRPIFYLSEYLENHRAEYYTYLQDISRKEEWNAWVQFYLHALMDQAKNNSIKVKKILGLYQEMRKYVIERTRSQYSYPLLDAIFFKPIFRSMDIQKKSKIPKQSLMPMLKQLHKDKILVTIREARGRMPAVLVFPKLLEITEGKPFKKKR